MGYPTQQQKVDYLFKKIGFTKTKTGVAEDQTSGFSGDTKKAPPNEAIASPLIVPGSSVWSDSSFITTTPPTSDTAYVGVYTTATAYRMTVDTTVANERTFIARQTWGNPSSAIDGDWIDTQFGADYLVKVYMGDPSTGVPGVAYTNLSAAGTSGKDDVWFFDYSSGVLNFNGADLDGQLAGISTDNVYLVGYRYIGRKGIQPPAGIGTFHDLIVSNNLSVGGISTFTGLIDANGIIEATAGQNKIPSLYANYSDLPNANTYHGMFAHVHATGRGYFAHAGNWMELVNKETNGVIGTGTERYNIGPVDATSLNVTGITTLGSIGISTGRITGPSITYIDPATVGAAGTVVILGNLQVDGTQTTVNSSTMTVTDKNIELAVGAANDAAADGGGITVKSGDGDKTWRWLNGTDSWTSSEHIRIPDGKVIGFTPDTDTHISRPVANQLLLTTGGAGRARFITTQTKIGPDADSATASTNYEFQISGYSTGNCSALSLKHGTSGVGKNLRQAFFFTNDGNTPVDLARFQATCTANAAGSESGDLAFYTTNSGTSGEKLRITGIGSVGINSTAPTALLDVKGTAKIGDYEQLQVVTGGQVQVKYQNSPRLSTNGQGATFQGNLDFLGNTNYKATFGASKDLEIFHGYDGTFDDISLVRDIRAGVGTLAIEADNVFLRNKGGSQNYLEATDDAGVKLNFAGAQRLETTDTGVDITDTLKVAGISTFVGNAQFDGRVGIGTDNPGSLLHLQGTGGNTSGLTIKNGAGKNVTFYMSNDTSASTFNINYGGTGGSDIQISNAGNVVFAPTTGKVGVGTYGPTSKLHVVGDALITGIGTIGSGSSGQAILQYQGSTKLETQSWGTRTTGTVQALGGNIQQYQSSANGTGNILLTNQTGNAFQIGHASSNTFITGHVGNISINAPQVSISTNFTVAGITTLSNTTFTGTISAGSTTGTDGYYLKTTGIGVTWAQFPAARNSQVFTATAGQTTFSFTYNVNYLDVFVNGVKLPTSEFTANNGTSVVLDDGCFVNDTVELITYNTTAASSASGGAQNLDQLDDVSITGTPILGDTLQHSGVKFVNDYTLTTTTTSTSQVTLLPLSASVYRSLEFTIQVNEGSKYHVTKILAIHDGSNVFFNEYGTLFTNSSLATFALDISGGQIRLLATPASTNSTTIKTKLTTIKV